MHRHSPLTLHSRNISLDPRRPILPIDLPPRDEKPPFPLRGVAKFDRLTPTNLVPDLAAHSEVVGKVPFSPALAGAVDPFAGAAEDPPSSGSDVFGRPPDVVAEVEHEGEAKGEAFAERLVGVGEEGPELAEDGVEGLRDVGAVV